MSIFKPCIFESSPTDPESATLWVTWQKSFLYYLKKVGATEDDSLPLLLLNFGPKNAAIVHGETSLESALSKLGDIFNGPINPVYARHVLLSTPRSYGKSIMQYLLKLEKLSMSCQFPSVTAAEHKELMIRDAFIRGISCPSMKARLLETPSLSLKEATAQATAIEMTVRNSQQIRH